jgi:hypothetical protein
MSSRSRNVIFVVTLVLVLSFSFVEAQDNDVRVLSPGEAVSGVLGPDNVAQVYTLTVAPGDSISISVTTESEAALGVLVTDALSAPVIQSVATERGSEVLISDVLLDNGGTYYVTVVSSSGISEQEITFAVSVEINPSQSEAIFTPPGQLLTATGLQISLTWNSTTNLDLEVRDPIGGSLRWETPTVPSGGRFSQNVNAACNAKTSDSPTEQASWQSGVIPTGSYEFIVYYLQAEGCLTTEPTPFTISATVDGVPVDPFEGSLQPGQVYLASLSIGTDGTVDKGLSGVKVDPPTAAGIDLSDPVTLSANVPVEGAITSQNPYQVYSFQGQDGQIVSLQMNANSGNLDPLLILLDPNGNQVAINDDRDRGITDSAITNFALILSGTYNIIATRYGLLIGGTEGEYTFTLGGASLATDSQTNVIPTFPDLPRGSVEVSLQWNTGADLQLLVRDPQGDSVYDDQPRLLTTGATLAANGNVNCQLSGSAPLSYIYWPAERLPSAGPYEIQVWYQSACNDPTPVSFTLNVVANDQLIFSTTQPLRVGEQYVTSYTIGTDSVVTPGEGGVFGTTLRPEVSSIDYLAQESTARLLANGDSVTGSIRATQKFAVYAFEGETGQVVTIGMSGLSGTLDSALFLVGPGGVQLAQNDDAGSDTRDSLINEFPLPETGRYIIIATHFGGQYGVTAGDYRLTLRLN